MLLHQLIFLFLTFLFLQLSLSLLCRIFSIHNFSSLLLSLRHICSPGFAKRTPIADMLLSSSSSLCCCCVRSSPFMSDSFKYIIPVICRFHLFFGECARKCKSWCRYPSKARVSILPSSRPPSPASLRLSSPLGNV